MSDNLKKYIITILLNKDCDNIDHEKYEEVIKALATNSHVDDICSYIMRSVEYKLVADKKALTDTNILNMLTKDFCVNKVYEYLLFLQNDHEPSHEGEYVR